MVNDWECVCTVDVGEGERLVAISWIDTGIKVHIHVTCVSSVLCTAIKHVHAHFLNQLHL